MRDRNYELIIDDLQQQVVELKLKVSVLEKQLTDEKSKVVNVSYFDNHTSLEE